MGVYALDMIPNNIPQKSIIIVNQDTSDRKGSHWIVLHYKVGNKVESIGRKQKKNTFITY